MAPAFKCDICKKLLDNYPENRKLMGKIERKAENASWIEARWKVAGERLAIDPNGLQLDKQPDLCPDCWVVLYRECTAAAYKMAD